MHDDQLDVDVGLVRRLVGSRFPQWEHLQLRPVTAVGTVNAVFHLGDALAVRVPIRGTAEVARAELGREASAAVELAGLPVAVPQRVALAEPGPDYPLPWSVQTWLPGVQASGAGSATLADDLADLVLALRALPTRGRRFTGTYRGGELTDHDTWVAECLRRGGDAEDTAAAGDLWARLREIRRPPAEAMTHGDLTPTNLLVDERGRLRGLLDLATFGPADPALDLVCAWHCFETGPRARLRARLGSDEAEWARGQAWALEQSLGLAWYYRRSNPPMSELGKRTLGRILADPAVP